MNRVRWVYYLRCEVITVSYLRYGVLHIKNLAIYHQVPSSRPPNGACPYAHARMHAQVFWIPQPNRKHSFLRAQQARHNRLGSTALPMQFPTDFKSGLICTRCPHIHPCPHPRSGMSHCGLVTVERSQSPMRGVAEGWAGAETLTDAPGLDRQ